MRIEKKTYHSGPYREYFAQGTLVDGVVYLSGQIGQDENGDTPPDIAEQTRIAYANIQRVLAQFGADMSNVVDETWFVTDVNELLENADAVYTARGEAYGTRPELCQTLVQVSGLVAPELKIEIKCVAHIKEEPHANL